MINTVVLMGRLTADSELKTTPSGISVTSFRIAVDRSYSPRDGGERQTDFIDIVAWRGTAEFVCKYFGKGQMIAVTGRIQTRNYEDKGGSKRTAVEVVADKVDFCGSKSESGANTAPQKQAGVGYWNQGSSYAPPVQQKAPAEEPQWVQQALSEGPEVFDVDDDLPF